MIEEKRIKEALLSARKFLMTQGPIEDFVHHNTLHAFEKMDFYEAVSLVEKVRESQVYKKHSDYLKDYEEGRFTDFDLEAQFGQSEKKLLEGLGARFGLDSDFEFFKRIILFSCENFNKQSFQWFLQERKESIKKVFKVLALKLREQEPLLKEEGKSFFLSLECLDKINKESYEFFSAFADKGISYWKIDKIRNSLFETFFYNYLKKDFLFSSFLKEFSESYTKNSENLTKSIQNILPKDLQEDHLESFFFELLKDVEGWYGVLADKDAEKILEEILLIRLLLFYRHQRGISFFRQRKGKESFFSKDLARLVFFFESWQNAYRVLEKIEKRDFDRFLEAFSFFNESEKSRILQLSYENAYYGKVAKAFEDKSTLSARKSEKISFAAVFCIDDREESFRRHLEECDSSCRTLGYAGFFNMDICYQSESSIKEYSLCPASMKPSKIISEKKKKNSPSEFFLEKTKKAIYQHSRTLISGTVLHMSLMASTLGRDFLQSVAPSLLFKISRKAQKKQKAPELNLELLGEASAFSFSPQEAAQRIEGLLKTIDLTEDFPEFVFMIGHGSSSVNNPHEAAYNCGACSGGRGAPNARVFAKLANSSPVRELLEERGIKIPEHSLFVGGYHDTSSDDLVLFDLESLSPKAQLKIKEHQEIFQKAAERNAQERARRFHSIPFLSPEKSFLEVQVRAEKYAQPRPECGHATNALCIVGDRDETKGLFLDRRAFLCSYNEKKDPDGSVLASLLSSVVPVCSGINLEYYFSYVDNESFGCGTKLPHNVTSLVGVMNGSRSDLRTGLPWQMVEIHEPVRLLLLVTASEEKLLRVKEKIPHVFDLIEKSWLHLALFDSKEKKVSFYKERFSINRAFKAKQQISSRACYEKTRENIDPCLILGGEL